MRTLRFFIKYSVADPDLQIRGGGHPDPEVRGGGSSQFFLAFRPHFGLKIRGWGPGPPVPSTGSATGISQQTAPSQIQYKNS